MLLAAAAATLVSLTPGGAQFTRPSGAEQYSSDISATGRVVAFTNRGRVYARASGRTELVGLGSEPVLDNSGRFVAFTQPPSVRIEDRRTGQTRVASSKRAGIPARRIVLYDKALTGDGRALLYISADRHGFGERTDPGEFAIYRYELATGVQRRITPFRKDLRTLSVSRTGRFVAYDGNGIRVLDTRTGRARRAGPHSRHGFDPAITGSGRYVTFATGDAAYLYDRRTRRTTRVAAGAVYPTPSEHGLEVAYGTTDDGSVGDAQGPFGDVFVWTRSTGTTRRLTDNGRSGYPTIATNGRRVVFTSVPPIGGDDGNGVADVYAAGS